jgi:crotonobetainyl-CoA:carnitine CoA-transferase CaiB-like acyl-CoA transferase
VFNAGKLDPLQMGLHALDRLYETSDGWLLLAAVGPGDFERLVQGLSLDLGEDSRFATEQARVAHDYELASLIGESLSAMRTEDAIAQLAAVGVTAVEPVPYNNFAFMRDPENRRNSRVAERMHPRLGRVRELAQLVRVSGCAPVSHRLAPELGEHTDAIYRQFGYPDEQIDHLVQVGAARRFASDAEEEKAS